MPSFLRLCHISRSRVQLEVTVVTVPVQSCYTNQVTEFCFAGPLYTNGPTLDQPEAGYYFVFSTAAEVTKVERAADSAGELSLWLILDN